MTEPFTINFGNAKPLVLPEEGTYSLVVSDWQVKPAKNEESRSKGFNIAVIFNFTGPEYAGFRVYHNIWVSYENPWAAKLFFEALTGKDLDEAEFDPTNSEEFIGETVGAALIHESYKSNTGQTKTKLAVASPDSFYTV
jgi:hypothetical protein